ncbi:histidine phosphatase family protein [Halomonas sp.]|uniref:histidine phosphatase family protein n=1 Tax=Halomonas sp. TaxID=1486246 RepID=UPI003566B3C5
MKCQTTNAPALRHHRYLLMRHGHSQANAADLIISHPDLGRDAYGLSPTGQAQLDALLADWGWPIPDRILHSDFLRTTQTATRIARRFGVETTPEPCLRERHFGDMDGGSAEGYGEVWVRDAESPDHQAWGVESVTAVAGRMCSVIERLEHSRPAETILLVSHGDPLQILLTALEGKPLNRHRDRPPLAPASITPVEPDA